MSHLLVSRERKKIDDALVDDIDDALVESMIFLPSLMRIHGDKVNKGGQRERRAANIDRSFAECHQKIYQDYFDPESSTFTEEQIRRRYRMPSNLMKSVIQDLENHDSFFVREKMPPDEWERDLCRR